MTLQYVWSAGNSLVSKEVVALIGTAPGTNTSAYRLVGYGCSGLYNASFEPKRYFLVKSCRFLLMVSWKAL